jgi:ATP-dependent Zn protease
MKAKRPNSIAYHEAGHAVIGRVLGMTCGGATIVPDYEVLEAGHALTNVERSISDWDARGRWRWMSMFRARIMMLMAGRESEIEVFGKAPDARFGDDYDLREIDVSLGEANVDGSQLDKWRMKTRGLVRRHRDAITKVATALLEHRVLSAEQIDEIVVASGVRLPERIDPNTVTFEDVYARRLAWATTLTINKG